MNELTYQQRDEIFIKIFNNVTNWAFKYSDTDSPQLVAAATSLRSLMETIFELNNKLEGKKHIFPKKLQRQIEFIKNNKKSDSPNIATIASILDICLTPIIEIDKKINGLSNKSSSQIKKLKNFVAQKQKNDNYFYLDAISLVVDVLDSFESKINLYPKKNNRFNISKSESYTTENIVKNSHKNLDRDKELSTEEKLKIKYRKIL